MLLDIIRGTSNQKRFLAGQPIFSQGDNLDAMYVIEDGEVDIVVDNEIVETVGPGDIFGEMAMIEAESIGSGAIAKTDCNLVPIYKGYFALLLRRRLDFALEFIRIVARRPRLIYAPQFNFAKS